MTQKKVNSTSNYITQVLSVHTDLDGPAYNHDGIVQRALRLLCELLCATSQDDGARLGLRAALEKVIPARRTEGFDQSTYRSPRHTVSIRLWRRGFQPGCLTSLLQPGLPRRVHTVPGRRLSWSPLRSGWSRRMPGDHITPNHSPSCKMQVDDVSSLDMQVVFWVLTIMVLFRSSSWTLPAQNRSLSAKYWVATSPIGNLDRTTLAPDL